MSVRDTFAERLPLHGLATDDIRQGLRIFERCQLLQKALIQYNARHSIGFIAYDIDSDNAFFDWEDDINIPPPNILALNPQNGHCHYYYGLKSAVHKYAGASDKALRYLAAVDVAMTATLKADPYYTKLIGKNPLSDKWIVIYPRQELYDLDELASWVDIEKYQDRRRHLPTVGYGRNCTLFETLRRYAYKQRRDPRLSEKKFHALVLSHGHEINAGFTPPLTHNEVRSTAKSISRWTWAHMSPEGFSDRQRRCSALAADSRKRKAAELRQEILQTAKDCPTLTQSDVAALHGVNQGTVSRHLKATKEGLLSDMDAAYSSEQGVIS